ncbi:MAG: GGDEF domain-containing protein [Planctomycetota bacterium]|nr:MAG: GGDEF domain-containing protein [Planctomycetota bacterium]
MSTVKDIESVVKQPQKLLTVKENDTAALAAKKMSDNHVGCLLVFDLNDKFVGVLTERDMIAKVITASSSPDSLLVKDIMTLNVISCDLDTPVAKVEKLMAEHKIRHVPIIKNGLPIGMISSRDVIAYRLQSNQAMKAAAEQLAMLPTGLKSLELDDVIALAISEVPKNFNAERAALCLAANGTTSAKIHQKDCPLSEQKLLSRLSLKQLSRNTEIISGPLSNEICTDCNACNGYPFRLIIPLTISEHNANDDKKTAQILGFLCMCRHNPAETADEELQLYKASIIKEVLSANLTNAKLYQSYRKARRDSETDPLTGVGARRVIEKVLNAEHARSIRYGRAFSVAIVDVDNFKQINDNTGHGAGDIVLQQLAKIMQKNVRKTDVITRYGGDEFVLLMPETKLDDAVEMLERLRTETETISIPKIRSVTISCGVAEWDGSPADTAELILKRADTALYRAKRAGRNQVMTSLQTKNET